MQEFALNVTEYIDADLLVLKKWEVLEKMITFWKFWFLARTLNKIKTKCKDIEYTHNSKCKLHNNYYEANNLID